MAPGDTTVGSRPYGGGSFVAHRLSLIVRLWTPCASLERFEGGANFPRAVRLCRHSRRGSRPRTKASLHQLRRREHDTARRSAPTKTAPPSSTARKDASDCLSAARNSCRQVLGFLSEAS